MKRQPDELKKTHCLDPVMDYWRNKLLFSHLNAFKKFFARCYSVVFFNVIKNAFGVPCYKYIEKALLKLCVLFPQLSHKSLLMFIFFSQNDLDLQRVFVWVIMDSVPLYIFSNSNVFLPQRMAGVLRIHTYAQRLRSLAVPLSRRSERRVVEIWSWEKRRKGIEMGTEGNERAVALKGEEQKAKRIKIKCTAAALWDCRKVSFYWVCLQSFSFCTCASELTTA